MEYTVRGKRGSEVGGEGVGKEKYRMKKEEMYSGRRLFEGGIGDTVLLLPQGLRVPRLLLSSCLHRLRSRVLQHCDRSTSYQINFLEEVGMRVLQHCD